MSKRKMKGWEFKSVLSSGEKKLLPRRVDYQGKAGSAHHATLIQGVVLCDCQGMRHAVGHVAVAAAEIGLGTSGAGLRTEDKPPAYGRPE